MANYFSHSRSENNNDEDENDSKVKLNFHQLAVVGGAVAVASPTTSSTPLSSRRPRGRPPGSKNKPKPPVIITKESPSAMNPMFLEISANADVLDAVLAFARRRRTTISILAGSGPVANVSLRHPAGHGSAMTYSGRYELLSLSGSFIPDAASSMRVAVPFTISLAGPQGQMIGGMVAGPLVAAGTVTLTAATFVCPEFYRLPLSDGTGDQMERATGIEQQGARTEADYGGSVGPQYQHHETVLLGSPAAAVPRAPPPHSHRPPPPAHY